MHSKQPSHVHGILLLYSRGLQENQEESARRKPTVSRGAKERKGERKVEVRGKGREEKGERGREGGRGEGTGKGKRKKEEKIHGMSSNVYSH